MSLATTPPIATPRRPGGSFLQAAVVIASLIATSLQPAAANQETGTRPFIVEVDGGFLFDFEGSQGEEGVSLHEFAMAAAHCSGRLMFWDEGTEKLLRERRVRLEGQKTVPEARFITFLQSTLLLEDFVCVQHGENDARVIQILSLATAESTSTKSDALIRIEDDRYVLDFGKPGAAKSTTLYEFTQSCGRVAGMQFTWDQYTEDLLKERRVRLRGKKSLPQQQLFSFLSVIMSISDMSCITFGAGDILVIRLQPARTEELTEFPSSTPTLEEPVVLTFGTSTMAESVSFMELLGKCQSITGKGFTWNQATDACLTERRMRLVGSKSLTRMQWLFLFQSLLAESDFSWEVTTESQRSVIKIDSL